MYNRLLLFLVSGFILVVNTRNYFFMSTSLVFQMNWNHSPSIISTRNPSHRHLQLHRTHPSIKSEIIETVTVVANMDKNLSRHRWMCSIQGQNTQGTKRRTEIPQTITQKTIPNKMAAGQNQNRRNGFRRTCDHDLGWYTRTVSPPYYKLWSQW